MSTDFKWIRVDFQDFINNYNKDVVLELAPTILHSKKDKEHESFGSLVAFFLVVGSCLIYVALSLMFSSIYFSPILFSIIVASCAIFALFLIINYLKSNINIRLIECWFEIHETPYINNEKYFCFTYYPIFTGKCHPNKAKNIIYKLYQEEILKSKLDISQIELYLKTSKDNEKEIKPIGFFFQYGEGTPFKSENINRNSWRFFPFEKISSDNYIATSNWDHQFEWREDLELDYDKLHDYAPWIIKKWNEYDLKPLTKEFKDSINWDLRRIESEPKLKPWFGPLETQTYESYKAYKDLQMVNEIIEKIIGSDVKIRKLKDLHEHLLEIKAYLRDLKK